MGRSSSVLYFTLAGSCFPAIYRGMDSIGPGRYREIAAMISSKHAGFMPVRNPVIPAPSSWNTPSVSPWEIISYTEGSSSGISSAFMSMPASRIMSSVSRITVRVLSPRKSIFSRPSLSMVPIGYWVVMTSSLRCSGTYSTTGFPVISTPAAWVEACLGMPSSVRAVSISCFTRGCSSYICLSMGEIVSALVSVIPRSNGIALATASVS